MTSKTGEENKVAESRTRRGARTSDMGEALLAEGLINPAQLEDARKIHRKTGDDIERILVRLNLVTEEQIAQYYARHTHLPYLSLAELEVISPQAVEKVPSKVVLHYNLMPVDFKN